MWLGDRYADRPVSEELSGVLAKLNDAIPGSHGQTRGNRISGRRGRYYLTAATVFADGGIMQSSPGL